MKFENSWVIAGVRGTSIAIQWDNITIYQSQQNTGGSIKPLWEGLRNLSKCSSFNTRTKDTKFLPPPYSMNRYCLSGYDDTILDFTKKDLIYLNELIEHNKASNLVYAEKSITAPQEIQSDLIFCPPNWSNQNKTTFWPNVTDPNEMCQDKRVVAVATLTPKDGKIVYKGRDGKMKETEIDIEWKPENNQYYYGTLNLNNDLIPDLRDVLQDSKIQTLSDNPFEWIANIWPIMQIHTNTTNWNPTRYVYSLYNNCGNNCYTENNIQTQWATSIQFWWSRWNTYFTKNLTLIFRK